MYHQQCPAWNWGQRKELNLQTAEWGLWTRFTQISDCWWNHKQFQKWSLRTELRSEDGNQMGNSILNRGLGTWVQCGSFCYSRWPAPGLKSQLNQWFNTKRVVLNTRELSHNPQCLWVPVCILFLKLSEVSFRLFDLLNLPKKKKKKRINWVNLKDLVNRQTNLIFICKLFYWSVIKIFKHTKIWAWSILFKINTEHIMYPHLETENHQHMKSSHALCHPLTFPKHGFILLDLYFMQIQTL